ncbi:hsp70-Hsp90 organizing protein 1 isoform X2 [Syngnathus acus]|uniref:hsp70-Hsp90 organizing protein 1 isoform X2 n=1 Tax=Syngnathus acus TaxID=161584 RepID=UPI001885F506|nr:hsp70-Hsp90 organizing protein 1 isoform X2 [Syngnathus acus]
MDFNRMEPFRTYRNGVSSDPYDYQDEVDASNGVALASRTMYDYFDLFYSERELMAEIEDSDDEWLPKREKIIEKAEKKRLKKKKRKERKRQEKMEKEKENTVTSGLQQSTAEENLAVGDKSQDGAEARFEVGAEAGTLAEELDLTSCFVSQTAQRIQHKFGAKSKPEKGKKKSPNQAQLPKESHNDIKKEVSADSSVLTDHVEISNRLATQGNECARDGRYDLAVDFFTQAIQYNPTEMRLFGNRAFCLEKLQDYEKALADAELCLKMSPCWIKGLFRKGRALAGLKRYEEAAQAFRGVLKLDPSCAEAAQEMMQTQILQLMEYGFTREQSSNALIIHGTVKKAREVLSALKPQIQAPQVLAAPETPEKTRHPGAVHSAFNIQSQEDCHPELFPVWVGNVNSMVTEELFFNMFSKAGSVHGVKLLLKQRCAFVNFTQQECCDNAIRLFHNFKLMGNWIIVRYPDRIPAFGGFSKAALRSYNFQQNSNGSGVMCSNRQQKKEGL